MSKQAVMNFIIKANQDKVLYEKVNSLPTNRVQDLLKIAREAGFDFTADEFVATVLDGGQLSESDMDQVAGGAPIYMMPTDQFSLNFTKFTVEYKPQ